MVCPHVFGPRREQGVVPPAPSSSLLQQGCPKGLEPSEVLRCLFQLIPTWSVPGRVPAGAHALAQTGTNGASVKVWITPHHSSLTYTMQPWGGLGKTLDVCMCVCMHMQVWRKREVGAEHICSGLRKIKAIWERSSHNCEQNLKTSNLALTPRAKSVTRWRKQ